MSLEIGEIKSKEDVERISEIILRSLHDDKIIFNPHKNTLGINSADLNSSLSYQARYIPQPHFVHCHQVLSRSSMKTHSFPRPS